MLDELDEDAPQLHIYEVLLKAFGFSGEAFARGKLLGCIQESFDRIGQDTRICFQNCLECLRVNELGRVQLALVNIR